MIHKFDKLAISLPNPDGPDTNAASCVQELLGGKFGEMSTLMNYTFQSFNFVADRGCARIMISFRTSPLKNTAILNSCPLPLTFC
jgi:Mn-containing catalase